MNSKRKDWMSSIKDGNWLPKNSDGPVKEYVPLKDEQIIDEIVHHPNLEDRGFFEDMVSWLRKYAPKHLRGTLEHLFPWTNVSSKSSADLSYERLCWAVYRTGFKASEILERRMILGPTNMWVKMYFKDFPLDEGEK